MRGTKLLLVLLAAFLLSKKCHTEKPPTIMCPRIEHVDKQLQGYSVVEDVDGDETLVSETFRISV